MIVVKNPDGTYTLTPETSDLRALAWWEGLHPDAVQQVITDFMQSRINNYRETKKLELLNAYSNATPVVRLQVRTLLGYGD